MPTIYPFPLLFYLFLYQTSSITTFVVLNLKERKKRNRNTILHMLLCAVFIIIFLVYTILYKFTWCVKTIEVYVFFWGFCDRHLYLSCFTWDEITLHSFTLTCIHTHTHTHT
jgi:hypothetical protein